MVSLVRSFVAAAFVLPSAYCFFSPYADRTTGCVASTARFAGKGFGTSPSSGGKSNGGGKPEVPIEKTYGSSARAPIQDMIDAEGAMAEFFSSNEEWKPLFRSFANSASVPAMSFLGGVHGAEIEFMEHFPWRQLDDKPTGDDNMAVVAGFLDSMQQSLVDIPVDEFVKEDSFDLHFIEEGRRMLAISRFHVLSGNRGGNVEHYDELFMTVWSELAHLRKADEPDTGSLIILPDYDLSDLRRFTDMNLQRPLDWLGIAGRFEVASMQRGSPAIRLLHRLSDIPTEPYSQEE